MDVALATNRAKPPYFPPRLALDADGGQPLDPAVRHVMESRFGTSFGRVRIHTGAAAQMATEALGAQAFTFGSHIFLGNDCFGADGYSYNESYRTFLVAHELAHVVQQGNRQFGWESYPVGSICDDFEMEANLAAAQIMQGCGVWNMSPDRSCVIRRAVKLHPDTARIDADFSGVVPAVAFVPNPGGTPAIATHLTKGFINANTLNGIRASDAWTAEGQVTVTAASNADGPELAKWQFGFLQFQQINALKAFYRGRNSGDGSISIDGRLRPAMPRTLGTDYVDFTTLPWARNPTLGVKLGLGKASAGDHPMLTAPAIWQNLETGHENFLRTLHDSRTFWTQFTTQDPSSNFVHLAFIKWSVDWEFTFDWNFATRRPNVSSSSSGVLSTAAVKGSPPEVGTILAKLPATPDLLGTPEQQSGWRKALAGTPPNRVDRS